MFGKSTRVTQDMVLGALKTVQEPELHRDLVTLNMVKDIEINDGDVRFTITLTTPACPLRNQIESEARAAVETVPGVKQVAVKFDAQVRADNRIAGKLDVPIKNIVAVGSGKGGVGKTTVAVNLAVALAQMGAKVGILDADIYGPNVPMMMGVDAMPPVVSEKMSPAVAHGVEVMSIGFLVPEGEALVWRGPMLHSAIRQLFTDVAWSQLDYLVVDLPPGTGDAQLSLAQLVPLTGGIIVSTPQAVSLADARRGITAFQRLERAGDGHRRKHGRRRVRRRRRRAGRRGAARALSGAHLPGIQHPCGRRRRRDPRWSTSPTPSRPQRSAALAQKVAAQVSVMNARRPAAPKVPIKLEF